MARVHRHGGILLIGNEVGVKGQEMVKAILTTEQEAAELLQDAQRQADAMVAEARDAVEALLRQSSEEARQEARRIADAGRTAADTERLRILAEARDEAEQLEQKSQRHFKDAVAYVVRRVIGRG